MQIPDRIKAYHDEMTAWRQDLHAHPELGFEEHRTSAFVAAKLTEFGCTVHRNVGKTGVVGVLQTGNGPAIGLRADMDALPIEEATDSPYKSKQDARLWPRNLRPSDAAVISVTAIQAGDAYNVIPHTAALRGTVRIFSTETMLQIEEGAPLRASPSAWARRPRSTSAPCSRRS